MTTCTTAMKPALSSAYSTATPNNVTISHSAAWIRLRLTTTSKAEARITPALIRKMISIPVMELLLADRRGLGRPLHFLALALAVVPQDLSDDRREHHIPQQHRQHVEHRRRAAQPRVE